MGMLETGTAHLADSMTKHTAVDVLYIKRKIQKPIKATRGSTPFEKTENL